MLLKGYTTEIFVFAAEIAEGAKGPEDCPALRGGDRDKPREYMSRFY
jgi:hypothetical protein